MRLDEEVDPVPDLSILLEKDSGPLDQEPYDADIGPSLNSPSILNLSSSQCTRVHNPKHLLLSLIRVCAKPHPASSLASVR